MLVHDLPAPDPDYDPISAEPASGYQRLLGYRLVAWREDFAAVELVVARRHLNRSGVVHGGVITALLDAACGYAVTYCPYRGRKRQALTLTLSTSYMGQTREGVIRAEGVTRAGGRRIRFAGAQIRDARGNLLASGEGSFRLRGGSETLWGVARER